MSTYQLTDEDIIHDLNTLEEDDTLGNCGSYHHCYLSKLLYRKYPELSLMRVAGGEITLYAQGWETSLTLTPTVMQQEVIDTFDDVGPRHFPVSKRDFVEHLQENDRDLYRQLFPTSIYSR